MTPAERKLIMGFLINKFRGDPDLFSSGIDYIEKKVSKPVLGLIPYFQNIRIDSEDSVAVQADKRELRPIGSKSVNIAVLRLPAISNFTDMEILDQEQDVIVNYLSHPKDLTNDYDCLILPGTKNVMEDAAWLNRIGWKRTILAFAKAGIRILGICGGYQLLGQMIQDPLGVESDRNEVEGLNLLPIITILEKEKIVRKVDGTCLINHKPVKGYEIHMGKSQIIKELGEPFLKLQKLDERKTWEDGWSVNHGQIAGTYLHGLFDSSGFRGAFLNGLREAKGLLQKRAKPGRQAWFHQYDRLADHFEQYCDVEMIIKRTLKGT
jgi:adenosylcobyric acid synthase